MRTRVAWVGGWSRCREGSRRDESVFRIIVEIELGEVFFTDIRFVRFEMEIFVLRGVVASDWVVMQGQVGVHNGTADLPGARVHVCVFPGWARVSRDTKLSLVAIFPLEVLALRAGMVDVVVRSRLVVPTEHPVAAALACLPAINHFAVMALEVISMLVQPLPFRQPHSAFVQFVECALVLAMVDTN